MLEIQSTQYVLWGDDVYTSEVSVGEEGHKGMMGNFFWRTGERPDSEQNVNHNKPTQNTILVTANDLTQLCSWLSIKDAMIELMQCLQCHFLVITY